MAKEPRVTRLSHKVTISVPFHDCDPLWVAWHGNYLKYFEVARCALLNKYELDAPQVRDLGYLMYVIDARCRYTFPARYDDKLEVRATITETTPMLRIAYRATNLSQSRISARGHTTLATTDPEGKLYTSTPKKILDRLVILLFVVFSSFLAYPAQAKKAPTLDSSSVSSLLKAFSSMKGLEADFVETKHLQLLMKPLVSKGKIYFARPNLLCRITQSPQVSRVIVNPQRAVIKSNGKVKTISLREHKEVSALVNALLWILSGDQKRLSQAFDAHLAADPKSWTLSLKPKPKNLRALVQKIIVRGNRRSVASIEVLESNGDRSVTTIRSANPHRRFSPQEQRKLFSAGK